MTDLYSESIKTREDHLYTVMSSERFLQKQGLNNEIPFFIFPYNPEEQTDVLRMGKRLKKSLEEKGVHILKINLYSLSIDLLKESDIFEDILSNEDKLLPSELLEDLQGSLDPERRIVPAIAQRMKGQIFDILWITGVGEVYPWLRSHSVLHNLQSVATEQPTLLWFPGQYSFSKTGSSSLKLFNRLPDSRYYRAFNILDYQI